MAVDRNSPDKSRQDGDESKRAYMKPSFRHEKVFEVMALSCGKIAGTQGSCHSAKKTS